VAVDVLAIDGHVRAMAQHPFDHRRHLGRRTAAKLRVDAGRMFLDMPVDHDAAPAIASVPFGHQVLIIRPELFRVGGTGGGDITPDRRLANLKGAVDDGGDRRTQRILLHEAPFHVAQFSKFTLGC
jgi:hypothetical protein